MQQDHERYTRIFKMFAQLVLSDGMQSNNKFVVS